MFSDEEVGSSHENRPIDEEIPIVNLVDVENMDEHSYNRVLPTGHRPKKMNKTLRLQNSLKISQDLLQANNKKNEFLENYYEQKLLLLKERNEIWRDIANTLKETRM